MSELRVLYFAGLVDLVGTHEESLQLPDAELSVRALSQLLEKRHPRLRLEGVRFAVNEEFAEVSQPVRSGDIVALIPPVSGG